MRKKFNFIIGEKPDLMNMTFELRTGGCDDRPTVYINGCPVVSFAEKGDQVVMWRHNIPQSLSTHLRCNKGSVIATSAEHMAGD